MLVPDIDLQLQLENSLDLLQNEHYITIDTNHVMGHQDTKKGKKLTWPETLNIEADRLASESEYAPKPPANHLPNQVVALHIKGKHITTAYRKTFATQWANWGTNSIYQYLKRKYNWT